MPIVWQGEDATIETKLVPTIAGPAAETCPGALLSGIRAGDDQSAIETMLVRIIAELFVGSLVQ